MFNINKICSIALKNIYDFDFPFLLKYNPRSKTLEYSSDSSIRQTTDNETDRLLFRVFHDFEKIEETTDGGGRGED